MPYRSNLSAVVAAGLAWLAVKPAAAQTPARNAPPQDGGAIWAIQDENAAVSAASLTDRYYVNGLRIGWTSGEDAAPESLGAIGRAVWGEGASRISVNLQQSIFTPADTEAIQPPPGDRPYAGVLMGSA